MVSPALSRADSPPAASAPSQLQGAPAEEKKTDLEARMDRMGKAARKLKKQIGDPAQNASSLELVATMQDAAKEALDFSPAKAEDLPQDRRAKFVENFKSGIKQLQDSLAKLRETLAAGRNGEAVAMFNDIQDFEKKEHKEFKKPKAD
jgi:soluble cytochrome b562